MAAEGQSKLALATVEDIGAHAGRLRSVFLGQPAVARLLG